MWQRAIKKAQGEFKKAQIEFLNIYKTMNICKIRN